MHSSAGPRATPSPPPRPCPWLRRPVHDRPYLVLRPRSGGCRDGPGLAHHRGRGDHRQPSLDCERRGLPFSGLVPPTVHSGGRADRKTLLHPRVGRMLMDCETLVTPDQTQQLLVLTPADPETRERLELLRVLGERSHPTRRAPHQRDPRRRQSGDTPPRPAGRGGCAYAGHRSSRRAGTCPR
ncbi:hypothetical protein [Saccharopolyspora erythraea]|uniref:MmyB family transcriptional regulator n=1 Tax=Saccharopolyspora erythraea TaxID=1836 RepID=UPI0024AEDB33|nr:hypothetical protein [Saccharopolyspora erythraea]